MGDDAYEIRHVALLDVLGWRSLVSLSENDDAIFIRLRDLPVSARHLADMAEQPFGYAFRCSRFSDTIVISAPAADEREPYIFSKFIAVVAALRKHSTERVRSKLVWLARYLDSVAARHPHRVSPLALPIDSRG